MLRITDAEITVVKNIVKNIIEAEITNVKNILRIIEAEIAIFKEYFEPQNQKS